MTKTNLRIAVDSGKSCAFAAPLNLNVSPLLVPQCPGHQHTTCTCRSSTPMTSISKQRRSTAPASQRFSRTFRVRFFNSGSMNIGTTLMASRGSASRRCCSHARLGQPTAFFSAAQRSTKSFVNTPSILSLKDQVRVPCASQSLWLQTVLGLCHRCLSRTQITTSSTLMAFDVSRRFIQSKGTIGLPSFSRTNAIKDSNRITRCGWFVE